MPLRSIAFLVPGRLEARTGGSLYNRHMVDGLRRDGWQVDVRELDASFPFPTPAALEHTQQVLESLPSRSMVIVDGLALGALPEDLEAEGKRLRIVALVHLPLAAAVGLDARTAARLQRSEQRALAASALVVVTGSATVALLAGYDVPRGKIVVVEPGTQRAPVARGSGGAVPHLLSVATINSGKGHEVLVRALASIRTQPWHLTCAGSLTRDPPAVAGLRAELRRLGLEERVALVGELDAEALADAYDGADLFVLATLRETYGMAVAEALARGLPVISTRTGAIADLVGDEAGVVVPVGDVDVLAQALAGVLADGALRARLAAGARRVRDRLPTWEQAAGRMAAALTQITPS
jgi:glycosyltransferase involved in cell wall biosynthesis